jgi:N-acylneuraminate cytidylyltransferase
MAETLFLAVLSQREGGVMKIKALIPVRAGSVRVPNKNIRLFAGSSLLEIKINQLKKARLIEGIIVNSDSDLMLSLSASLGCETIKREAAFAMADTAGNDFFQNIADTFTGDIIVMTAVTNPLLKADTISRCIDKYLEVYENGYDSVNTAHPFKDFILLDGKPWNFSVENWTNSQYLPDTALYNNAVNVIEKRTALKSRNMIGFNPYFEMINPYEAIDINNPIDFEIAEELYKRLVLK